MYIKSVDDLGVTQPTLFDYTALEPEARIVVQQEDKEFDDNMNQAGSSFLKACHNVKRIHEALKYKRPGFVDWVESKSGFTYKTANRMLDVAKMFDKLSNIPIGIGKSALYLLAAPSTPESARIEVLERAEAGEQITHAIAKEISTLHQNPIPPVGASSGDERFIQCIDCRSLYDSVYTSLCPYCNKSSSARIDYLEKNNAMSDADILQAAREIKKERAKKRMDERLEIANLAIKDSPELVTNQYKLFTTPISEFRPASIDIIITDPPYPKEYLETYSELSEFAYDVLPDGGLCIVMTGQSHLAEVIQRLSENLTYMWTMAYMTPGQSSQIFGRRVKSNWKPVLYFVKGKSEWEHVSDTFLSSGNDKRYHHWGQDVSGMADILERFTVENQVVCDPFCGAGTTGVAAILNNRFFVGSDIDESEIAKSGVRLNDAKSAQQ